MTNNDKYLEFDSAVQNKNNFYKKKCCSVVSGVVVFLFLFLAFHFPFLAWGISLFLWWGNGAGGEYVQLWSPDCKLYPRLVSGFTLYALCVTIWLVLSVFIFLAWNIFRPENILWAVLGRSGRIKKLYYAKAMKIKKFSMFICQHNWECVIVRW